MTLYPSERRAERERTGRVRDWLRDNGYGWRTDGTFGFLHGAKPQPAPPWSIEGRARNTNDRGRF
jgi:hypothetical protein